MEYINNAITLKLLVHDQFGYGLLNALEFVQLAEKHTRLPIQVSQRLACIDSRYVKELGFEI